MRAGSSLSHTRAKWSRSIWREGFYASPLNFLLVLCCEPARRLMFALFLCLLSSFLSGFVLLCNCVRIPRKLTVGLKNQVKPCVSFIAESVSWKHTRELRIVWILLKYWASQVTEVMRSELFLMLPANSKHATRLTLFATPFVLFWNHEANVSRIFNEWILFISSLSISGLTCLRNSFFRSNKPTI